ncbi:hypothetical protein [Streptomyces sp. V1I6]|uniref:hypothetical protein n=1 Tax=Streptomyces sp. V1I6 TaxID=3042273 RepID=UPI00277D9D19|nr:hypothetical protein [Streptomyces sp. V1I6]MDQ0846906.1 hypothetical protein [Streptomyces sp. V1I6]
MSAPTPTGPEPEGPGLQRPDFGQPSPALLERADRGYARFLAVQAPDVSAGEGRRGGPPMSNTHVVLYDPQGMIEAEAPLNRAPYEALVTAVLAWENPNLPPRDYEQITLQLPGPARAVAADVERRAASLPKNDGGGSLAGVILREAADAWPHRYRAPLAASRTAPASYRALHPDGPPHRASLPPSSPQGEWPNFPSLRTLVTTAS